MVSISMLTGKQRSEISNRDSQATEQPDLAGRDLRIGTVPPRVNLEGYTYTEVISRK